jgi:lipoate-protein ligase A
MPTIDVIKNAVMQGFQEVLKIELVPGELTHEEKTRFRKLLPYIQSEKWIYGYRRLQDNQLKVVDYKCTGGLIRVYTRIDPERQLLKTVFITGDFFAYPDRIVLDLEVALKNSSVREEDIRENVQTFFSSRDVHIPNMEANDFSRAIIEAVKKEGKAH